MEDIGERSFTRLIFDDDAMVIDVLALSTFRLSSSEDGEEKSKLVVELWIGVIVVAVTASVTEDKGKTFISLVIFPPDFI